MSKRVYAVSLLMLLFASLDFLFADDAEFRLVSARNDQTVGGELHLDLEMRITNGTTPRTLNSITVDVYYGSELTEWADDPSINWSFSFLNGYSRSANKLSGYYRILVTGNNVNANGNSEPPGDPAGWDVTTNWQRVCTLRWTINTATSVNIYISDDTDAAAYFDNYTNAPQGGVTDWVVTNQDIGDISLPVELSSFTAECVNNEVVVTWITESEIHNLGFEVYRSAEENGDYTLLSSYKTNSDLSGQGNASTKHTYSYTDKNVLAGNRYWYKISDVDLNGIRTYHGPLNILVNSEETNNSENNTFPAEFKLGQNYPNPFNPETSIDISIPEVKDLSIITVDIFNINGQKIKTLFKGELEPGIHSLKWNGTDDLGKQVSGGMYFYYLKTNKFQQIKKMILLK
jgi:methionine-rich copper-binding protein CopC